MGDYLYEVSLVRPSLRAFEAGLKLLITRSVQVALRFSFSVLILNVGYRK